MKNKLCDYGCGQKAKYQFKNGKWCCSKNISLCPAIKNKIGQKNKGNIMSIEAREKIIKAKKGKKQAKETIKKIKETCTKNPNSSCFKKGHVTWNTGLTKETDIRLKRLSDHLTGKKLSKEQRQHQSETKKKLYKDKSNHPSYKGKYFLENIPLYDTYAHQLTIEEKPKRDKLDLNILTVICTHCKRRYIPTATSVQERCRALKGTQRGELRLYCSDECKLNCSIFNKHKYQKDHPIFKDTSVLYTASEYQTFRQYVLERDKYICQYCGEKAEHVHHERPQKLEPFFSLDPDLAWSCCENCHYKYGHKTDSDCSTGNLANKICIEEYNGCNKNT